MHILIRKKKHNKKHNKKHDNHEFFNSLFQFQNVFTVKFEHL